MNSDEERMMIQENGRSGLEMSNLNSSNAPRFNLQQKNDKQQTQVLGGIILILVGVIIGLLLGGKSNDTHIAAPSTTARWLKENVIALTYENSAEAEHNDLKIDPHAISGARWLSAQTDEPYILVTGGLGYIGSHTVVELMGQNEKVIIVDDLDNSNIKCLDRIRQITNATEEDLKFFELNILNLVEMEMQIFSKFNIKSVIHFAGFKAVGESGKKPLEYYDNNVAGTITLMQMMKKYEVKNLVFSSSATVYGENPHCKEGDKIQPINVYGRTKSMVETVMEDYAKSDPQFTAIALRYFNPIGAHPSGLIGESPNDIPNNLMPYIMKVATGNLPYLGVFGNDYHTVDGTGVRDYIHVCDLAKGHIAALSHAKPGFNTYNLGTGHGTSVLELVSAFEKAAGKPIEKKIQGRRDGDSETVLAIPSKANTELGWKTQLTIEDMCRDVWNWAKNNPNGYE